MSFFANKNAFKLSQAGKGGGGIPFTNHGRFFANFTDHGIKKGISRITNF